MLTAFDWIRRSENGSELIATLDGIKTCSGIFHQEKAIGHPASGIDGPCKRCWIYPRLSSSLYCRTCNTILDTAKDLGGVSRQSLVVWGYLNSVPESVQTNSESLENSHVKVFLKDENHFLVVLKAYELRAWFKEILTNHGSQIKGSLTVFPTTGKKQTYTMGDILCQAIQHDSRFPMDRLRIRFFSSPGHLKNPYQREKKGLLNFDALEFLNLLETATLFSTLLSPEEQEAVKEVLSIQNEQERRFHWGRLMGQLTLETRDMLFDLNFTSLPKNMLTILDELCKICRLSPLN